MKSKYYYLYWFLILMFVSSCTGYVYFSIINNYYPLGFSLFISLMFSSIVMFSITSWRFQLKIKNE